jgi:hypothetical protein
MGKRESVFYIGRVTKAGFNQDEFIKAILEPKPFEDGVFMWNIVNVREFEYDGIKYYHGKLNKAKPDATVRVMTEDYKIEIEKEEPDLIICSSEFVYIPLYSGIAFHSLPGKIEPRTFVRIFKMIIEHTLGNFFVECTINLIDDMIAFINKLRQFDSISSIKIIVNPPNPLYGRFWESLKNYLQERKADEILIKEKSKNSGLFSKIIEMLEILLRGNEQEINEYLKKNQPSLTDAGILMSMDGYGNGRIDGKLDGRYVFIKTHEKSVHFTAQIENVEDVFIKANTHFKRINDERHMEH